MAFEVGATVRQYHDSTRLRYDEAVITYVHGNGALDVVIGGKSYGWSEHFCEVVRPPTSPSAQTDPHRAG